MSDPRDGLTEHPCPNCAGMGDVVTPIPVVNQKTGEVNITQRADACHNCSGTGIVWQ